MNLLRIRHLGLLDYRDCWQAMREFTAQRVATTPDEIWMVEHPPVYTLGMNGNPDHLLYTTDVPVVQTDRGGQITWHGPGQLIAYTLIDLRRARLGIRQMIHILQTAALDVLQSYGIAGETRTHAPGVYVNGAKIASVGLRVVRGCSYHGMSLNIHADLSGFSSINPCGFPDQPVTSIALLGVHVTITEVIPPLAVALGDALGFSAYERSSERTPLPPSNPLKDHELFG